MTEEDDLDLTSLNNDELVEQMHDDLYDGLAEEIEEGVNILLGRGWMPYKFKPCHWSLKEEETRSCNAFPAP